MSVAFNPIPVIVSGIVGAGLVVAVVYVVAARWKRRSGIAYCLSAVLFFTLLYLATFQYSILNIDTRGKSIPADTVWLLVLGQSAITAFGVAVFTMLLFGGFLALRPRLDGPVNLAKSFAGCALFCLAVSVFFDPMGAAEKRGKPAVISSANLVAANARITEAAKSHAKTMLDKLLKQGVVERIVKGDTVLTHYMSAKVRKFPDHAVEEYARAALVYHIYFDGGRAKRVVLKDSKTGRRLAVREPDGRFKRY